MSVGLRFGTDTSASYPSHPFQEVQLNIISIPRLLRGSPPSQLCPGRWTCDGHGRCVVWGQHGTDMLRSDGSLEAYGATGTPQGSFDNWRDVLTRLGPDL